MDGCDGSHSGGAVSSALPPITHEENSEHVHEIAFGSAAGRVSFMRSGISTPCLRAKRPTRPDAGRVSYRRAAGKRTRAKGDPPAGLQRRGAHPAILDVQ